jgi:hypothetical protein
VTPSARRVSGAQPGFRVRNCQARHGIRRQYIRGSFRSRAATQNHGGCNDEAVAFRAVSLALGSATLGSMAAAQAATGLE